MITGDRSILPNGREVCHGKLAPAGMTACYPTAAAIYDMGRNRLEADQSAQGHTRPGVLAVCVLAV